MRKLFGIVCALAGAVYAFRNSRNTVETVRDLLPGPVAGAGGVEAATRRYMMYFMLPLWIVPGILDWMWHRRTQIENTSGTRESLIHALMMTEVGLPILGGLFLEINAGMLAVMIAAYFLHEATAFWDVSYAVTRRRVLPREQHTHSFLEMLPFSAVSFLICLHPRQFEALFGFGPEKRDLSIRLKDAPLPAGYIAAILGAVTLFIALPYAEELKRCIDAQREPSAALEWKRVGAVDIA